MYYDILDEASRDLYDRVSSELTLEPELRLMRVRVALAIAQSDDRTIRASCDIIIKLVRAQAAIGGKSELAQMLDEVGDSIVAKNAAEVAAGL